MTDIDIKNLTPMMQQYMQLKEQHKDSILFYRLGDFYEMFFEDAIIASKELELALTGRDCGLDEKAPMCGIPHYVAEIYINRLVSKGYKVSLVEQIEDPKVAKGIVKRGITRVISPGTIIDLEGKNLDNNFLCSIFNGKNSIGISYIDVTTGELNTTEFINTKDLEREVLDFVVKIQPKEIIFNSEIPFKSLLQYIKNKNIFSSILEFEEFDVKKNLQNIKNLTNNINLTKIKDKYFSVLSISFLLNYVYLFRNSKLNHIIGIKYMKNKNFMKIDASTRENLEIHKNLYEPTKKNTLFEILDKTNTPMGSRKINSWLEFPLINIKDIEYRLSMVDFLFKNPIITESLDRYFNSIYDIERLLGKISYQKINGKDLISLKNSIENLPKIKNILKNVKNENIKKLYENLDDLIDIKTLIEESIIEDSPIQITEGGIIKPNYSKKLDELKNNSVIGNKELIEYEISEREKTGIKNLKISYNKNTGYYIELTNSNIVQAPDYYIRRQTLKNSERYITEKLNLISDKILGSKNEIIELEYKLFNEIREEISKNAVRIKTTAEIIATIDALLSFSKVAKSNDFVMPKFNENSIIDIKNGRHPIVENIIGKHQFIANNVFIDKNKTIQIITGPNMAGKSTYMRQTALILIMAQVGSFVPCDFANISISDALFSRIGASDNLAKGDSTFMVEMKEMSNIIKNANENSFIILDEVGRGTGTNDGYSIAKAIIEYLSKNIKAKTLFATHYHELTRLEDELDNVSNLKVEISEENGDLIFLRKIMKGKANKSYGIEVAKLSGLPQEIISKASLILSNLNEIEIKPIKTNTIQKSIVNLEQEMFLKELSSIDLDDISPREAWEKLEFIKKQAGDLIND